MPSPVGRNGLHPPGANPVVRDAYAAQVDKNVRKAGQFREVLSLALTYRLC
jgi:hypothetical protein